MIRRNETNKTTMEELEAFVLFVHWSDKKIHVGTNLGQELKTKLIDFLRTNVDCFAWSHLDMAGIPPVVMI